MTADNLPLSYTQNLEDYHLWLALGEQGSGFYIDVGGGHPVADNVSLWFYERGWRGIVVEPQAALANLYAKIRPRDALFQGLIGRKTGSATLHMFPRLHGLSTTVAANADRSSAHGDVYESVDMPMCTLADLCSRHSVETIDFLKIDVEGAESDVLAGNDWARFRPKIIVAESIDPASNRPSYGDWEPALLNAGYLFRLDDTLNRFYVAREYPEIFQRLPANRADWNAVRHMYEIGKAPEEKNHPDHQLANEITRGFWALLPELAPEILAACLARGRAQAPDAQLFNEMTCMLQREETRIAHGRIACGYDGGQID